MVTLQNSTVVSSSVRCVSLSMGKCLKVCSYQICMLFNKATELPYTMKNNFPLKPVNHEKF